MRRPFVPPPSPGPVHRRGVVAALGGIEAAAARGTSVVEVPAGFVVCPGFIDTHVHLREPGQEQKETTATRAAAGASAFGQ